VEPLFANRLQPVALASLATPVFYIGAGAEPTGGTDTTAPEETSRSRPEAATGVLHTRGVVLNPQQNNARAFASHLRA